MSFWEFLVIVLVALLVLGPRRLYEIAVVLGRMTRRARQLYAEARAEMERDFREGDGASPGSGGKSAR